MAMGESMRRFANATHSGFVDDARVRRFPLFDQLVSSRCKKVFYRIAGSWNLEAMNGKSELEIQETRNCGARTYAELKDVLLAAGMVLENGRFWLKPVEAVLVASAEDAIAMAEWC